MMSYPLSQSRFPSLRYSVEKREALGTAGKFANAVQKYC